MMDLNGHEAGNGGHSQGKSKVHRVSSTRQAKYALAFGINLQRQLAAMQLEDRQIIRGFLNRHFPFSGLPFPLAISRTALGFHADLVVEDKVIVEIKSVETVALRTQKAAPQLSATGRQTFGAAHPLQCCLDQKRHHAHRKPTPRMTLAKTLRTKRQRHSFATTETPASRTLIGSERTGKSWAKPPMPSTRLSRRRSQAGRGADGHRHDRPQQLRS